MRTSSSDASTIHRATQHHLRPLLHHQLQQPRALHPANALITTAAGNEERAQTLTLGDTYTVSPTLVNSFHATFSRRRDNRGPASDFINAQTIGINEFVYVPNDLRVAISNSFSVGCGTCSPGHFNVNTYQVADDMDYIRGNHHIAFGVNLVRTQLNSLAGYLQNGNFSFNGQFTNDPIADFLLGDMNTFGQSRPQQVSNRLLNIGLYVQDTWHATSRLTVNGGLRWEPTKIPVDYFHRGSIFSRAAFDANQHSSVYTTAPAGSFYYGDPGVPEGFAPNHWANFSPRLGLAWNRRGDGKETIRVGSSILYDSVALYTPQRLTSNPPVVNEIDITNPGRSRIHGRTIREAIRFPAFIRRRRMPSSPPPRSGFCFRRTPSRPPSTTGISAISGSLRATGCSRPAIWATRRRTSGSGRRLTPLCRLLARPPATRWRGAC